MNRSAYGDLPEPVRQYFEELKQMQPPSGLLDDMVAVIEDTPQQQRFSPVLALGVGGAAVVVLSIIGFLFVTGPPAIGDPSTSTPSPTPVASDLAEPSRREETPRPTPRLGLPGMGVDEPAGEYGWLGTVGGPGEITGGMHKVVGAEDGEFRQTQLTFAVADDCFPKGGEPERVTVAGLDGLYVEPYEDPDVLFVGRGGETTGAYALPIGGLTLCVYLSWDPETTDDELESARQVVESIRGRLDGPGQIYITFTLPEGWDTG